MKAILKSLCLLLIISSCTKINEASGPYSIKGRVLNNCEDQQPVANQLLYFYVDYDTSEEERVTYTDDQGFFEYSFDGPAQSESVLGGTIRVGQSKIILAGVGGFGKEVNTGDLYLDTPKNIQINFNIKGTGYSDSDSLFLSVAWPVTYPRIKLAGPFDGLTTDTVWMRYATTDAGTMENYTTMNQPEVKRLKGQYGSVCYWEIRNESGLVKQGREEITFDACITEAEITINLSQAP